MQTDPSAVIPPDDTGAKTFSRFCYQAHLAFRFCLDCALDGTVVSVVPEHIEDIAVEYADRWRFIQVKTRESHLGPWRLSDLTAAHGGLRSLLRAYRVLRDAPTIHELFLEGPIDPRDSIRLLLTPDGRRDTALRQRLGSALALEPTESADFLERLRLVPDMPARQGIMDRNLRYLGAQARQLPFGTLMGIYELTRPCSAPGVRASGGIALSRRLGPVR